MRIHSELSSRAFGRRLGRDPDQHPLLPRRDVDQPDRDGAVAVGDRLVRIRIREDVPAVRMHRRVS